MPPTAPPPAIPPVIPPATPPETAAPRLVILWGSSALDAASAGELAFRYAASAAAMDMAVELHAVSAGAVQHLAEGAADQGLLERICQAVEAGACVYVCPAALARQGLVVQDLIEQVSGVRGAASLLAAGLAPGARFLNF
jgi:predicted peroxiredoxin